MESISSKVDDLRRQIARAEEELNELRAQLTHAEKEEATAPPDVTPLSLASQKEISKWPLSSEEYKRYGRQMIVPNIGIKGKISYPRAPRLYPFMYIWFMKY
jgi:adenylyltransferase/sulfurtransferase